MGISDIDEEIVLKINRGDEYAFSLLYKAYYAYLNSVAICYLFDRGVAGEIVDDVFVNVWYKREQLNFPIHFYLVRSVQNGCLNYIRGQQSLEHALQGHKEELMGVVENYIRSTPTPIQHVELQEVEQEIRRAVNKLPEKCRAVFISHFYEGKSTGEIAEEQNLTMSTVRVQLKNAVDRLRPELKHLLFLLLAFHP